MPFYPAILHKSIVIAMLLIANVSIAQDKRFMSLTTADGLPQNSVEAFAQDSVGFLWIGTQDGLVKYDGYEMQVFRNDPKDSNSLSDNFITKLHIDDHQNLWLGTRNGVNLYQPSTNTFWRFLPYPDRLHQVATSINSSRGKVMVDLVGWNCVFYVQDSINRLIPTRVDSIVADSITCIQTFQNDSIVVKANQVEFYRDALLRVIELPEQLKNLRAFNSSIELDKNSISFNKKEFGESIKTRLK